MGIVHIFLRLIYRAIALTGFFSTRLGQQVYGFAYDKFKLFTEGRILNMVSVFIKPDSLVIDVGANIGFYTKFFLNYVGAGGKVAAVEPEQRNLTTLRRRFPAELKSDRLVVVDRVVTDKPGNYHLHIDRYNPGGHTMAPEGIPVKGITIDQLVSQMGLIPSLIKIDVEGYEELVIRGASETIANHHPALYMEFHPRLLSECGTDYARLLRNLASQGYQFFLYGEKEQFHKSSIEQVVEKSKARGWNDILVIPEEKND